MKDDERYLCSELLCRTAIGNYGGALEDISAVELGTLVVKEALKRANVKSRGNSHILSKNRYRS